MVSSSVIGPSFPVVDGISFHDLTVSNNASYFASCSGVRAGCAAGFTDFAGSTKGVLTAPGDCSFSEVATDDDCVVASVSFNSRFNAATFFSSTADSGVGWDSVADIFADGEL